jgi:predicted amidohydrolase YtcJ
LSASLALALPLLGCRPEPSADAAETIYRGGPIVTLDDAQPSAEAIAVAAGKIVAVGSDADVMKRKGPATQVVDLGGKTMTAGFIDGHAHVAQFGAQAIGANLLAAPDGNVNTIEDLVAEMKRAVETQDTALTGWVFGIGYDDAVIGRHPTRDDLDKVSTTLPILAVHISGHFSVLNSVGLQKVGYTAASPDPEGGVIRRRAGSREPDGVNEENAHFAYAFAALGPRNQKDADRFLLKGLEVAKSFGFTTANEGRATSALHHSLRDAASRGLLDIDVISYVDFTDRAIIDSFGVTPGYTGRYRIGGMKITLDGSVPGRTAWLSVPYVLPPPGQKADYRAYPSVPDDGLLEGLFEESFRKGWPVHVHANGDAAVDQLVRTQAAAFQKYGAEPFRITMIHGVAMRREQLDSLKKYNIFPSLFPMHTFYWGDWYDKILGPERAQGIAPMASAIALGMTPTSHSDSPVALPNLMQVMWATVNRTSRSGQVMGPDERISAIQGLKSIALWSAIEHKEGATKGSIEVGKLADLVILSDNPITIDPAKINTIRVLETIKEGKSVWKRGS